MPLALALGGPFSVLVEEAVMGRLKCVDVVCHTLVMVWGIRDKISRTFCAVLCTTIVQSHKHAHMSNSYE